MAEVAVVGAGMTTFPATLRAAKRVEHFQQPGGEASKGGARIGLVYNIGGPTAASAITILRGPGSDGE
ncbi:MAG: hypothetical protein ACRDTK_11270 [Mycobacterium sp.]